MLATIIKCPQCQAPLTPPSRFARSAVCGFCGATALIDTSAVSVERFRKAREEWDSPSGQGFASWLSVGDAHWATIEQLAQGEVANVYLAQRARWPTELVVLKVLHDPRGEAGLSREWDVLRELQRCEVSGAAAMTQRLPDPVVQGVVSAGVGQGARALAYRWAPGFLHDGVAVRRALPNGIPAACAVWLWRRVLEVVSFVHRAGLAHGAVVPPHILVERGEHGARLLGYSRADRPGRKLRARCAGFEAFFADDTLSHEGDVTSSGRCMAYLLGGEPARGQVPDAVPRPLAELVRQTATGALPPSLRADPWALREKVGSVARAELGPPAFHPLPLP